MRRRLILLLLALARRPRDRGQQRACVPDVLRGLEHDLRDRRPDAVLDDGRRTADRQQGARRIQRPHGGLVRDLQRHGQHRLRLGLYTNNTQDAVSGKSAFGGTWYYSYAKCKTTNGFGSNSARCWTDW
jgi:hypothetical protein